MQAAPDSVEGVSRLDAEHAPLKEAFQQSTARAKLVAILSPT